MTRINPFDLPAVERAQIEFGALAAAVARAEVPLIVGTRRLIGMGYALGLSAADGAFRPLVALDSETVALPAGPEERARWAPDALPAQDRAIAEAEARWGADVREACRRLAARFAPAI